MFGRRRNGGSRLGLVWGEIDWTLAMVAADGSTRTAVFPVPREDVSGALRTFLVDRGWTARRAAIVLPQSRVVSRVLTFPTIDEREIESMAALQAGRLLPLGPDEIVTGHWVLEKRSDGNTQVLFSVARVGDVRPAVESCRAAGLAPEAVLVDLPLLARGEEAVFVRVLPGEAQIGVWSKGAPVSLRGVPWGGSDEGLIAELAATMADVRRVSPGETPRVLRLSGVDPASTVAAALVRAAGAEPAAVSVWDAEARAAARAAAAVDLGPGLLPSEDKIRIRGEVRRRAQKRTALLTGFALVLAVSLGMFRLKEKEDRLAALIKTEEALSTRVAPLLAKVEALEQRVASGNDLSAGRALRVLEGALPPRTSLGHLVFERDRRLRLDGEARGLTDALSVVSALEKTAVFHRVELRGTDAAPVRGGDRVDFQIECALRAGERRDSR